MHYVVGSSFLLIMNFALFVIDIENLLQPRCDYKSMCLSCSLEVVLYSSRPQTTAVKWYSRVKETNDILHEVLSLVKECSTVLPDHPDKRLLKVATANILQHSAQALFNDNMHTKLQYIYCKHSFPFSISTPY